MSQGAGEQSEKKRPVTGLQLLALGVNGIVGVGIFFVPAAAASNAPGYASVVVFALTGVALLPAALAFAALGRRFDEDGGPVVFARAAFGESASFLVGWVAYVSAFLSVSAVMVGLTRATAPALGIEGPVGLRLAAVVVVTILALVVGAGISVSARVWTALTVLKLLPLLALVVAFVLFRGPHHEASLPAPSVSWLRAGLTVMFAYQGFEIVPVIAGQVRSSSRAIPVATVGSLLIAIALYVALVMGCVVALPELAGAEAPLAQAGAVFGGATLGTLVAAGTSVSALGIALGMMVTTPRYLSALASGGRRLWRFHRISDKGVPLQALIATWVVVIVFVNLGELGELFALSAIAVLMQFGVAAVSLVVLAFRRERGLRPRDAWPALPTLILAIVLVVFGASRTEVLVAVGVVLVGLVLLKVSKKRASDRAGSTRA